MQEKEAMDVTVQTVTGKGAVKIAAHMVNEGLFDSCNAVKMVEPWSASSSGIIRFRNFF